MPEEVTRASWHDNLDIKLVTVKQLLEVPTEEERQALFRAPATVSEIPVTQPVPASACAADHPARPGPPHRRADLTWNRESCRRAHPCETTLQRDDHVRPRTSRRSLIGAC